MEKKNSISMYICPQHSDREGFCIWGMGKAEVFNSPSTADHILGKRLYQLGGGENEEERIGGKHVHSKHLKRRCIKWGDDEHVEMGVNRGESGFLCNGFSPSMGRSVCARTGMKRHR